MAKQTPPPAPPATGDSAPAPAAAATPPPTEPPATEPPAANPPEDKPKAETKKAEDKGAIYVRPVNPYKLHCHSQNIIIFPDQPTKVQLDAWIEHQIEAGTLEKVDMS